MAKFMGQTQPKRLLRRIMSFFVIICILLIGFYTFIYFVDGRFQNIAWLYAGCITFCVIPAILLHFLIYNYSLFPHSGRIGFLFQVQPVFFLLLTCLALALFPHLSESFNIRKEKYFIFFFILMLVVAILSLIFSVELCKMFFRKKLKEITLFLKEYNNKFPFVYYTSYAEDVIDYLRIFMHYIEILSPLPLIKARQFLPETRERLLLAQSRHEASQQEYEKIRKIVESNNKLLKQILDKQERSGIEITKMFRKQEIFIQNIINKKYKDIENSYLDLKNTFQDKFDHIQAQAKREISLYAFYAKLSDLEKDKFLTAFVLYHFSQESSLNDKMRREKQLMTLILLCQVVEIILKRRVFEPFKGACQNHYPPLVLEELSKKSRKQDKRLSPIDSLLLNFITSPTGFLTLGQMFGCIGAIKTSKKDEPVLQNLYLFLRDYMKEERFVLPPESETEHVLRLRNSLTHINEEEVNKIDIKKERENLLNFIEKILAQDL
jgi:hypothetical protein